MQRKEIEEELVAEAKRLKARLVRFTQEPDPPQEIVPQVNGQVEGDLLDAASREAAVYQEEVLQRFLRTKGIALEEARQRLQAGSYGICQGCGEPIPEKRLKAVPYAAFCFPCQEQREK
ncbi:MAG: TraR/DksA family transcriptional regulator [candidate division NC10 bacterium]|nr:TraR/DksA family transcriptional regulator [candidate division NC10 bacterium]